MNLATVTAIRAELEAELAGRKFGKIFQLTKFELAVDLRLPGARYLFISFEPGDPRTYLIKRRLRDLEKGSINATPFSLILRKRLSGAVLTSVEQVDNERVLAFVFEGTDENERPVSYTLVAQLTGTSANLFLLNTASTILEAAKITRGAGQQVGDIYAPPARPSPAIDSPSEPVAVKGLSEKLDAEDLEKTAEKRFDSVAASARNKINQEISKHRKLIGKLEKDREGHGDAERWKRFGDLLLANAATARRDGDRIYVTDYFDDAAPEIAIDVDENDSITDAAERFFKRYTKARNARVEIEQRLREIERELAALDEERRRIEEAVAAHDEDALVELSGFKPKAGERKPAGKKRDELQGTRSFMSSDGFEILVGKKAKDNDFLTFRIAKSLDTWMHAADYPGSHVVIRNPNRKDVPHRTLLEAAQLAAFYSQGKKQPKAAVHYTQRKFVNKPRGAAPGLVSLSSFKTILVEPKIGEVKSSGR